MWAVIFEGGIEGVTFQAVATQAGVSVGRIQHYFGTKRALVLEGARAIVATAEHGHHVRTEGTSPEMALLQLLIQPIPTTEGFRLGTVVWYVYLAQSISDPGIGEIILEAVNGQMREVQRLVVELGTTEDAETLQLAHRLTGLSNGLAQAVLVGAISADQAVAVLAREIDSLRD